MKCESVAVLKTLSWSPSLIMENDKIFSKENYPGSGQPLEKGLKRKTLDYQKFRVFTDTNTLPVNNTFNHMRMAV